MYPISAQVNEVQPDSAFQAFLNSQQADTARVVKEKDFLESPI